MGLFPDALWTPKKDDARRNLLANDNFGAVKSQLCETGVAALPPYDFLHARPSSSLTLSGCNVITGLNGSRPQSFAWFEKRA